MTNDLQSNLQYPCLLRNIAYYTKLLIKRLLLLFLVLSAFGSAQSQTAQGTDFWVAPAGRWYSSDTFRIAVSSDKPTKVYLEIAGSNYRDSLTLGYNEIKHFMIPRAYMNYWYYYQSSPLVSDYGLHVTSKLPIRCMAFSDGTYYSCGATAVYPTSAQTPSGTYQLLQTRYDWGTVKYKLYYFTVLAIDDSVTVQFNTNTTFSFYLPVTKKILLRRGQYGRFFAYQLNGDMTMEVEALNNKRISVFSENRWDYTSRNCYSYDLMYEHIQPDNVLGKKYIVTPFMTHKKGFDYSVTTHDSGTVIYENGKAMDTLGKNETFYGSIYADTCVIVSGSNPISCFQKSVVDTCSSGGGWGSQFNGPSVVNLSNVEQFVANTVVSVPKSNSFNIHYINILVPKYGYDSTYLDGVLLDRSEFKPYLNKQYYLYRDTILPGNHRIINNFGFISYLYGRGKWGGYAYNGSASLKSLKRFITYKLFKGCDTNDIIELTSDGIPAKNFQWRFSGYTDTGKTVYFNLAKSGTYVAYLKYRRLSDNQWDSVSLNMELKKKSITQKLVFIDKKVYDFCDVSRKFTLPKSKLFLYKWNNNTADSANVKTFSSTSTNTLITTNRVNGCKFYDTFQLNLHSKLIPDFTYSLKKPCPGYPIFVADQSTVNKADSIVKFLWMIDNQKSGTKAKDTIKYAYPGTYDIKMIITAKSGCVDSVSKQILINDIPSLVVGMKKFDTCYQRSNIRFNSRSALSIGKIAGYKWIWDDGDTTYTRVQAIRNIKDSGIHWFRFAAFTDLGCSDTTPKNYYKIYGAPSPMFAVTDSSVCKSGNFFSVDNQSIIHGQASRYEWMWGDGTGETFEEPGYKNFSDTGTFPIRLVAAYLSTGCSDTFERKVRVLQSPTAKLVVDSSNFCLNHNYYAFRDISDAKGAGVKYVTWKWGDGSQTIDTFAYKKRFKTAGTFKVKMYFSTGKGCIDSTTKNVPVYASPIASFIFLDSNNCGSKNSFNIKNNSTAPGNAKWNWDMGDGSSNNKKDPGKKSYTLFGDYTITLSIVDPLLNCVDTMRRKVTVLKAPIFDLKYEQQLCSTSDTFNFEDNTDYGNLTVSRTWKFDNVVTDTSHAQKLRRSFGTQGIHIVNFIGGEIGVCADTVDFNVKVQYDKAPLNIGHSIVYPCVDAKVDLSSSAPPVSWTYDWTFPGGNAAVADPAGLVFNTAGEKKILLKITDADNCVFYARDSFTVLEAPELDLISLLGDTQCLKGNSFDYNASLLYATAPVNYSWKMGEGKTASSAQTNPYSYANPGSKKISLMIQDKNGCVDSASVVAYVFNSPTVDYTVQDGCIGEQKFIAENITPSGIILKNLNWYVDNVNVGSGSGLNYDYLIPGGHSLYAIVETEGGCKDTGTLKNFTVFVKPIAAFDIDIQNPTSSGVPVKFLDQSSGATKWWWNPEGKVKVGGQNFSYIFARLGNTTSWLKVENDFGCSDSTSRDFLITSSENHFFPNAFTPNADGRNDVFRPFDLSAIVQFNMMVYDRWGAKIFESKDPNVGWDGKFRGANVPDGGYVYSVNLVYLTGKRFAGGGTVIIMR